MRSDSKGLRSTLFGDPPKTSVVESSADGIAEVSSFLPGEWVGIAVRFPGRGFETRTLVVPSEKDAVVEIPSKSPTTPDREVLAGGDASKKMFVTGPKAGDIEPATGYGLVVVLPGGDGGEGFQEWVRERYDEWVDAGWVWAQLVAPKWDAAQTIVWPTAAVKAAAMKFTTEEFVDAAVEEVAKSVKVDRTRVVAVSWSSSGPACWRMLSAKSSAVTAHLIAMSVFHPKELEPLANGKQRPLFLLHSPDDKTCPIAMAEQGRDAAKKAGLKVEWATYEGGHGWEGESEDQARRGLRWLAESLR
jgi:predicted esterase